MMKQYIHDDLGTLFEIKRTDPLSVSNTRIIWEKIHDNYLLELTSKYKEKNWTKISNEMQKAFKDQEYSAKKCRERWYNCVDPSLDKSSLTQIEELLLFAFHNEYKTKWSLIAQHLPNRNSGKVKNNFSSFIRKVCRKINIADVESDMTVFCYIQTVYALILIHDLMNLKEPINEVDFPIPIHLYRYTQKKKLTTKSCLGFMFAWNKSFVSHFKDHPEIQGLLKLKEIKEIKLFINNVTKAIRNRTVTIKPITEIILFAIIESALEQDKINVAPNNIPLPEEKHYINHQSFQSMDRSSIPIPELVGYNCSIPSISFIPSPFISPSFQTTISALNTTPSSVFSPIFPVIGQTFTSPVRDQFILSPVPNSILDPGNQRRISDFTNITNRFVN